MIEYDFTELDNDFITVWANYLMYKDKKRTMPELTELAENGQVNAVQKWIILNEKENENSKISDIISSYKSGYNFNQKIALANQDLVENQADYNEIISHLIPLYKDRRQLSTSRYLYEELGIISEKIEQLEQKLANTQYFHIAQEAIDLAMQSYNVSNNPLTLEAILEFHRQTPITQLLTRYIDSKRPEKLAKVARKQLENNIKNNDEFVTRNKFALAKNYYVFDCNKKQQQLLSQYISELANRELSIERC